MMTKSRSDNTSDNGTVLNAQKQLQRTAKALEAMALELAMARSIKEFDGDRRKRELAIAMKVFLDQGETSSAAECRARASDTYGEALIRLSGQYQSAIETIEKYESQRVLWESARSLLSVEKAKIHLL